MMAKEPDSGDLPKALKILRDISCRAEKGESETHWDLVRQGHVLAEALSSAAAEERDAEAAAALPDLAAAVFRGEAAMVNEVFSAVAKAVAAALSPRSQTSMAVRTRLLERFCSRYISEKDVLADLVKRLVEEGICVEEELLSLGGGRQRTAVIKAMVAGSGSARQLESVMGSISPSRCQQDFRSVLFSPFCIPDDVSSRLCSYLGSCLPGADLVGLLKQSLRLWGDPVIARAHVSREVIRYSKLVLLLLSHTPVEDLSKVQSGLVGLLARGLPNHFSSSDGRTVELAKTIGEILTETFKRISGEENVSDVPDGLLRPQNELCQQLLDLVHSGKASEDFWMNKLPKEDLSVPVASSLSKVTINEDESKPSAEVDSDDDDDSDLEPIESLEPPPESKVRYLRDFLEGLPEMKDHSDAERAFRELPAVARRQLEHEHSAVGKELMEAVFLWENEFNDPVLDTHRRNSLTAVVSTRYTVELVTIILPNYYLRRSRLSLLTRFLFGVGSVTHNMLSMPQVFEQSLFLFVKKKNPDFSFPQALRVPPPVLPALSPRPGSAVPQERRPPGAGGRGGEGRLERPAGAGAHRLLQPAAARGDRG